MEAAAESIRELRAILPDRPHQLSQFPDWVVTSDLPPEPSFKEELRVPRLGYMTFSSEADRGLVFTRSYDDVRPKPMPREVNLARTGHAKKISINDYKKKKETPPVTPLPGKGEDKLKPPPANLGGGRPENSTLPPRPPVSLPPKPPTPDDSKKRRAPDDGPRAQKRQRPSDVEPARDERPRELPREERTKEDRPKDGKAKEDRAKDDRATDDRGRDSRTKDDRAKDDRERVGRPKEDPTRAEPTKKKSQEHTARDTSTPRDKESSALPNGRSMLKAVTNSRGDSPTRARGSPVTNGVPNGSIASKEPKKPVPQQKPSNPKVPRLLSPLHLPPFDEEPTEPEVQRAEKKRRVTDGSAAITTKAQSQKPAKPQATTTKRPKIPALLSPTLPPAVEAELQRIKKASQQEKAIQREKAPPPKEPRDTSATRPSTEDDAPPAAKAPSRMIVKLKVSKLNRKRFSLLMKITESGRSGEKGVAQRAEKRPRASSSASQVPPSTPSKKGPTAMSRVSSSNSAANTPGDAAVAATPSVPDSADRASQQQNKPPELREKERARVQLLKDKEIEFKNLGRTLKHKSDDVLKKDAPNGTQHQRPRSDTKSGWAHLLESLLCFVASFHCADVHRGLMKQDRRDYKSWASLSPLAGVLEIQLRQNKSARDAPMVALKTMVQLIATEEMLAAFVTQKDPDPEMVSKIIHGERSRTGLLTHLRKVNESMSTDMRITVTPWALEDTVADMLRITRRWCADEGVKWEPMLNLKDCGLKD